MRFIRAAALSLLASSPWGAAGAEAVNASTRWLCIDTTEMALRCHVEQAGSASPAPSSPSTAAPAPLAVRSMREQPGAWRRRVVLIPLFNHPIDAAHVRELAQAVLCGPRDTCSARLAAPGAADATDWLAFADAHDPLLAHPALDQAAP